MTSRRRSGRPGAGRGSCGRPAPCRGRVDGAVRHDDVRGAVRQLEQRATSRRMPAASAARRAPRRRASPRRDRRRRRAWRPDDSGVRIDVLAAPAAEIDDGLAGRGRRAIEGRAAGGAPARRGERRVPRADGGLDAGGAGRGGGHGRRPRGSPGWSRGPGRGFARGARGGGERAGRRARACPDSARLRDLRSGFGIDRPPASARAPRTLRISARLRQGSAARGSAHDRVTASPGISSHASPRWRAGSPRAPGPSRPPQPGHGPVSPATFPRASSTPELRVLPCSAGGSAPSPPPRTHRTSPGRHHVSLLSGPYRRDAPRRTSQGEPRGYIHMRTHRRVSDLTQTLVPCDVRDARPRDGGRRGARLRRGRRADAAYPSSSGCSRTASADRRQERLPPPALPPPRGRPACSRRSRTAGSSAVADASAWTDRRGDERPSSRGLGAARRRRGRDVPRQGLRPPGAGAPPLKHGADPELDPRRARPARPPSTST